MVIKSDLKLTESMIKENEDILVAVSGGVDSMVLLELLNNQVASDKIHVVHFNHNLREESAYEFKEVKDTVRGYNNQFYGIDLDVEKYMKESNKSMETSARELRYMNFEKLASELGIKYIYLGHHGDDLVETVLMRLVSGAKNNGLVGMTKENKIGNVSYLRPLLDFTKDDLYHYAKYHGLLYFEDLSNEDTTIKRNYIRQNILPSLKELNPLVHNAIGGFSNDKSEDEDYFKSVVAEEMNNIFTKNGLYNYILGFDIKHFKTLHISIQKRLVKELVSKIKGESYVYSKFLFETVITYLDISSSDFIELSKGLYLVKEGNTIWLLDKEFTVKQKNKDTNTLIKQHVTNNLEDYKGNLIHCSDLHGFTIRKDGKRIKKYFSEKHIAPAFRNNFYFELDSLPSNTSSDLFPIKFVDMFGKNF